MYGMLLGMLVDLLLKQEACQRVVAMRSEIQSEEHFSFAWVCPAQLSIMLWHVAKSYRSEL